MNKIEAINKIFYLYEIRSILKINNIDYIFLSTITLSLKFTF